MLLNSGIHVLVVGAGLIQFCNDGYLPSIE
jgi:hypothetical protein